MEHSEDHRNFVALSRAILEPVEDGVTHPAEELLAQFVRSTDRAFLVKWTFGRERPPPTSCGSWGASTPLRRTPGSPWYGEASSRTLSKSGMPPSRIVNFTYPGQGSESE